MAGGKVINQEDAVEGKEWARALRSAWDNEALYAKGDGAGRFR